MSNTVSTLHGTELQIFTLVVSLGGGNAEVIYQTAKEDDFTFTQHELKDILAYLEQNSLLTVSDGEYSVSEFGRSEFREYVSDVSETDDTVTDASESSNIETPDNPFVKLTGFQRDILATIWYGELQLGSVHGLTLQEALTEQYGKDIHHGRLYPNLDTLVEKGLVEKSRRDTRTNNFYLTSLGWDALQKYDEFTTFVVDEEV